GVKGLHPKHEALLARDEQEPLPGECVEIRLVRPAGEDQDADTARRVEAEELARWLAEEVLSRQELREKGVATAIRPRHIAILLRTLTATRDYVEALRRHGIPYVTEGEKHFYERQEVMDFVNLLRAVLDPYDRVALVGVLRSPLGGLTDLEIAELAGQGFLDYRRTLPGSRQAGQLYERLRQWHMTLPRCSAIEAVNHLLAETPMRELAAASLDGEQALANLYKLRGLVDRLAQRPEMTLRRAVRELTDRLLDPPDEAESPLAEEGDDDGDGAVRVLSIHKAKGLEYPMVILAGLHRGSDRRQAESFVLHDWVSGVMGLRIGGRQTIGGLYAGTKLAWRQQAELHRVLYVGMTRAKRRLVLSAGLPASASRSADSLLSLLSGALGELVPDGEAGGERLIDLDGVTVPLRVCEGREAPLTTSGRELAWTDDSNDYVAERARWAARETAWETANGTARFLSPTRLCAESEWHRDHERTSHHNDEIDRDLARLIGTAVHRVLEIWDFQGNTTQMEAHIEEACRMLKQQEPGHPWDLVAGETADLLRHFIRSPAYADLQRAEILGREVPFAMPWPAAGTGHCLMEGIIDVIYRIDGKVHLADYKTDRVQDSELAARAAEYEGQARIYREAVSRCLGTPDVKFQLIFVRNGKAVSVEGLH
ncbi:MAG TPA: 3'-5' exonuclease, partial [Nitrospiraceae bacterium]|nr:3'-5' exonuclease [Nitrospiraceae bacterium]